MRCQRKNFTYTKVRCIRPRYNTKIPACWVIIHMLYMLTGGRAGVRKRRSGRRSNAIRYQQTLRRKLKRALQPIEDKLTAFVRQTWPQACNRNRRRKCRPCFSLIRQYLPGERRTHNIHRDDHALVTAVVSFSDYGRDFLGGLYVQPPPGCM